MLMEPASTPAAIAKNPAVKIGILIMVVSASLVLLDSVQVLLKKIYFTNAAIPRTRKMTPRRQSSPIPHDIPLMSIIWFIMGNPPRVSVAGKMELDAATGSSLL